MVQTVENHPMAAGFNNVSVSIKVKLSLIIILIFFSMVIDV